MALFDSLSFNPSGYSGLLGDLLSRLQFQQPTPSSGFGPLQQPQQPATQELSAQAQMAGAGSNLEEIFLKVTARES